MTRWILCWKVSWVRGAGWDEARERPASGICAKLQFMHVFLRAALLFLESRVSGLLRGLFTAMQGVRLSGKSIWL